MTRLVDTHNQLLVDTHNQLLVDTHCQLLVDTHCHLHDDAFDEDRDAVLQDALTKLEWLVVVGDTLSSSRQAVALVQQSVYATVGIHPHHADEATPDALAAIKELTRSPHVVALGEIGLDYHYMHHPRETQQAALERQLELAAELALPVVIHNRDSHDDMTAILDSHHPSLVGGVMHCFAGGPAFAEQCLAWGLHISFAGNVTFPKAQELRDAALVVPMDRLLVETDSPYLAPKPLRGKRCEPAFVQHTAKLLADLKGIPLEQFARQTTENANRLFRPPLHQPPAQ